MYIIRYDALYIKIYFNNQISYRLLKYNAIGAHFEEMKWNMYSDNLIRHMVIESN